jgi:hypothetical protein
VRVKILLASVLALCACSRQIPCDGVMTDENFAAFRRSLDALAVAKTPTDALPITDAMRDVNNRPTMCRSRPRAAAACWQLFESDTRNNALFSPAPAGDHVNYYCDACKAWTEGSGILTPTLRWRRL